MNTNNDSDNSARDNQEPTNNPDTRLSDPPGYFKKRTRTDLDAIVPAVPAVESPNFAASAPALIPNSTAPTAALTAPASPKDDEFLSNYLAKLSVEQRIAKERNKGIIYEPVGSIKFVLLCFCVPLHAYEIWWIYCNLVYQQKRNNDKSSPIWRVNMLLFYIRGLLNAMKDEGKLYGIENELAVEKIILYWCMLFLCSIFPPPAAILGMFSFAPLIYVNEYLIKLNKVANPDLPINSKITFSNWLIIIAGAGLFVFNTFVLPQLLSQLTTQLRF
jgi:hypothetical protein